MTFIGVGLLGQAQTFLLNITNLSQLAASDSIKGAIGLVAIIGAAILFTYLVLTRNQRKKLGVRSELSKTSALERALARQTQLADITSSLRIHHRGIIDRMEQWDYDPRELGEMIFMKRAVPGKTFGPAEEVASHGPVQGTPPNLEKDKMHLKEFLEPWELYSVAPKLCGEAKRLEDETSRLVKSHLTMPVRALKNWSSYNLLDKFAEMVISKADDEYKHGPARDFEGHYLHVNDQQYPALDFEPLFEGAIADAQTLATTMNKIRSFPEVKDIIGKRRDAWNTVNKNKDAFLRTLNETVIGPARSSNYDDPRLAGGTCDDCRPLKEKYNSLVGE